MVDRRWTASGTQSSIARGTENAVGSDGARCCGTGAEDEVVPYCVAENHLHRQEPESILVGEVGTENLETALIDSVFALGVENPQSRGKSLPMSSGPGCDSAASRH